jgi:hypothetical protein
MTEQDLTPEDGDVQGHARPQATEDDDVQGHARAKLSATEDDDDVQGHARTKP